LRRTGISREQVRIVGIRIIFEEHLRGERQIHVDPSRDQVEESVSTDLGGWLESDLAVHLAEAALA